jgi:hypothetical protein
LYNWDMPNNILRDIADSGKFGTFIFNNSAELLYEGNLVNVTKPGFYPLTDTRFERDPTLNYNRIKLILFTSVGKFKHSDIIKSLKESKDNFCVSGIFSDNAFAGGAEYILSKLGSGMCLPFDPILKHNTPEDLSKIEYVQRLYKELVIELSDGHKQNPVSVDYKKEDLLICNNSIPLIFNKGNVFSVNNDYSLVNVSRYINYASALEGVIESDERSIRKIFPHWYSSVEKFELIFASLNGSVFHYDYDHYNLFFKNTSENIGKLINSINKMEYFRNNSGRDTIVDLLRLSPGNIFKERINKYFADNGFPGLKATVVWPAINCGSYTEYDWSVHTHNDDDDDDDDGEYYQTKTIDAGYYLNISYNKKNIISKGSDTGFKYVSVKDEGDKIRLIHSNRCQHISAWSKNVTDQGYSHWEIIDWITGPMAEEGSLIFSEAPAIFMGNKNLSIASKARRNALDALRNRQANLNTIRSNNMVTARANNGLDVTGK